MERGSNGRHGFVIPNEEAARKGRIQHVEGTSNMCLIAEARTMIGRRREPVISRKRRSVSLGKITEVVVRHTDRAHRVDGHRGREGWPAGDLADRGWRAPGRPAVGGCGDQGLVDGSARESSVLPDRVQLSGTRVDGDRGETTGGANGLARVRVGVIHRLLGRDDCRLRPGAAAVGRRDEGNAGAPRREVRRAGRLEQLEEVVEDARAGIDHDLVADGLAVLPGIEDRPGARPGLAAVSGLGEPGRAEERVSAQGRIRAVARGLEPVPHNVGRATMNWISGDGLLVVEELGELEDGAGSLVGLD